MNQFPIFAAAWNSQMTGALILSIALLFRLLMYIGEKKGGWWESVPLSIIIIVFGVPWVTFLGLSIGALVSTLTILLPLSYVISDSAWDTISSTRFYDDQIGLWTLLSVIPWGIIGWLEIGVARRIWRGWKRKRDKTQAIEEEIRTVSEIKIIEPQPWRIEQRFEVLSKWIDSRERNLTQKRTFLFWIPCHLMFCLLGVTFSWVTGMPIDNFGDFIGAIIFGYIPVFFGLLLILSLPHFTWISLRWSRTWLAQNLPRGLVWRYRSWQLRRTGRRLRAEEEEEKRKWREAVEKQEWTTR